MLTMAKIVRVGLSLMVLNHASAKSDVQGHMEYGQYTCTVFVRYGVKIIMLLTTKNETPQEATWKQHIN